MTEEQSIDIKNDMVFVKRVSPLRFIYDPSVTISNIDEAKWVGRIIDVPLVSQANESESTAPSVQVENETNEEVML